MLFAALHRTASTTPVPSVAHRTVDAKQAPAGADLPTSSYGRVPWDGSSAKFKPGYRHASNPAAGPQNWSPVDRVNPAALHVARIKGRAHIVDESRRVLSPIAHQSRLLLSGGVPEGHNNSARRRYSAV